ncbi:MAG: Hsp20/alpha crystallin family protein [Haloferacaceae archaeon]
MTDRDDPFAEIERLVEQFGGVEGFTTASVPVDVVDAAEAVVVRADLPGFDAADIDVTVDDGTLALRATREAATAEADERYVRRERERREVSRRLSLPAPVREREATASYDDGVLTVRLPKRDDGEGHEIEIE